MTQTVHEQVDVAQQSLQAIPVDQINRNLDQPRKLFDVNELEELADSIQSEGLMQPITVRPDGEGGYQIVAGERRWRAHCILMHRGEPGFDTIPCHVKQMDDLTRDISAIVENLLRVDIAPLEEAAAFGRLVARGISAADIARRTGKSSARIEQRLSLLRLAPDIAGFLAAKRIDEVHATEIARLDDHEQQRVIFDLLQKGKIGAWQSVKNAVDALLSPDQPEPDAPASAGSEPADNSTATAPQTDPDADILERMEGQIDAVTKLIGEGWSEADCLASNRSSMGRVDILADGVKDIRTHVRNMEKALYNAAAVVTVKRDTKGRFSRSK
jgi:ParB family transcriptional regulator, chromosome partitioning protein